jgi:hypothetical protein
MGWGEIWYWVEMEVMREGGSVKTTDLLEAGGG